MKIDQVTYQPQFLRMNPKVTESKSTTAVERDTFEVGNQPAAATKPTEAPRAQNSELVSPQLAEYLSQEEMDYLAVVLRGDRAEFGASAYARSDKGPAPVGTRLDLKG